MSDLSRMSDRDLLNEYRDAVFMVARFVFGTAPIEPMRADIMMELKREIAVRLGRARTAVGVSDE